MKKYGKIVGDKVAVYSSLNGLKGVPINFDKASESLKNQYGFYEVEYPFLGENETYEDLLPSDLQGNKFVVRKRSLTQDELAKKRQEKYLIIDGEMRRLSFGAIAIILGLKGLTTEELLARKQLYETLYEYCSMPEPPAEIEQIIEVKRQLFNAMHGPDLTMSEYKQMVIEKWQQGEVAFKQFNLMIEAARTKWKSVVDDEGRFNAIYDIIKSVDEDTRPEDVPTLFNQVMSV